MVTDSGVVDLPTKIELNIEDLPTKVQRFANPKAPKRARMMAAKGLVPVQGNDLVALLVHFSGVEDAEVRAAAEGTLDGLPEGVLVATCSDRNTPIGVLDGLADRFRDKDIYLEALAQNQSTGDQTIAMMARHGSERLTEIIAVNQQRLLKAPEIIEALYKNRNTRMSTADRLIDLAVRNDVELTGIPSFKDHADAIRGQLIPEPSEEPLPTDVAFTTALEEDDADDAIDLDKVDGSEEVKEKYKPLSFKIQQMSVGEKIRLSVIGDAAARAILVRDPNRVVSSAAISSPAMKPKEAIAICRSTQIGEEILRYIGRKREWTRSYEVKRGLCFNPKTPITLSMRFLTHLRQHDLKALSRSRGIPSGLKNAVKQRMQKSGKR